MKILVDENIPRMTVAALADMGHDVMDVRGMTQQGLPDPDLWQIAVDEQRLLITTDKGFAAQSGPRHPGVLIVRLKRPNRQRIHQRVLAGLSRLPTVKWPGRIVTVRDHVLSVRRSRLT